MVARQIKVSRGEIMDHWVELDYCGINAVGKQCFWCGPDTEATIDLLAIREQNHDQDRVLKHMFIDWTNEISNQ